LKVSHKNGVCVLRPEDSRIDQENSKIIYENLSLGMKDEPRVVLDLSAVGFLDSAGIGQVILPLIRRYRKENRTLAFFTENPRIFQLLKSVSLEKIAPLYSSLLMPSVRWPPLRQCLSSSPFSSTFGLWHSGIKPYN
jgi:anti-anti-sigma factor